MEGAFVVFKGSTARKKPSYETWTSYRALKEQLVKDGKLVDSDDPEYLVFSEDVEFSSPSAAATVVAAGSRSGPVSWKVAGTGQTYQAWQEERLNKAGME